MADAPIGETLSLGLSKWADKKNPGATALNENWEKVDAAQIMHGEELPETYQPNKLFILTGEDGGIIYRNDGTLEEPDFVEILNVPAISEAVEALDERVGAIETADGENVKRDGSVAMTGDLDFGGNKALNASNATTPTGLVTKQQLEAAITGALEDIGVGSYKYVLARNTEDIEDTSPVLFVADENDPSTTDEGMHVEDTPPFIATQDGFYLAIFRGKVANGGGGSCKWLVNGVEAPACVLPLVLKDVGYDDDEEEGYAFLQDICPIPLSEGDELTLEIYGLESEPLKIKAESTAAVMLIMANGAGGGNFNADGSVPMTGDLDFGGNKGINAAAGVDPNDVVIVDQLDEAIEDLQEQIDEFEPGGATTEQAPEIEVTAPSGYFAFVGVWSEFLQSRLDFTVPAGGRRVKARVEATALPNLIGQSDAQIGIRFQKMLAGNPDGSPEDFYGQKMSLGPFGYGMVAPLVKSKHKTLAASDWRISIICRKPNGAMSNSSAISANVDCPAWIGVSYLG